MQKNIKGPFSYSGNKFRIFNKHLKQIFEYYERVHEPFAGSATCLYNAKNGGIGLDINPVIIALHNSLKNKNFIEDINYIYKKYFSNGRDKKSYNNLRFDFNNLFLKF